MFGWFLNLIYLAVVVAASPVLLYRSLRFGKYRAGWGEKLFGRLPLPERRLRANPRGLPPTGTPAPRVWFHAVSVGEVLQLQTVLREFERVCPQAEIVVTTTTSTGLAVAKEKFPEHHVCYFPLDFTWAVRNAVNRIRPDVVVLVELELWPNFIREVHRSEIPLALVNGRISEGSFEGYHRIRFLMKRVLGRFSRLAVQNETYAERLRQLGAPPARIDVTGSIKFDGVATDRNNPQTEALRAAFGLQPNEPVFIAGSTHAPEEETALRAWSAARKHHPDLRLIIIPRHQERFEEVARLVESRGIPLQRRSRTNQTDAVQAPPTSVDIQRTDSHADSPPVCLLDTLGELSACWGLADVAFVGGSLTARGGQNMIEPAAFGAAVTFGPNTRNFRDVVEILLEGNAARVVRDESELASMICDLLDDPATAHQQGSRARDIVVAQQGATSETVSLLVSLLPVVSQSRAHLPTKAA